MTLALRCRSTCVANEQNNAELWRKSAYRQPPGDLRQRSVLGIRRYSNGIALGEVVRRVNVQQTAVNEHNAQSAADGRGNYGSHLAVETAQAVRGNNTHSKEALAGEMLMSVAGLTVQCTRWSHRQGCGVQDWEQV